MARHNREDRGVDQHGELWTVSYQPDWFRRVKISRQLPDGRRRSSMTLVENPADGAEDEPGKTVRTRISAADGSVDFQVALEDRDYVVERIVVHLRRKRGNRSELVKFNIHANMQSKGKGA